MNNEVENKIEEKVVEEINKRDGDFFKFEEDCNQTIEGFKKEYPDYKDEELEEMYSDFLIENVKVSVTEKGNISKTLCGHKITEIRGKDNTLIGIGLTLYGKYQNKKRDYKNFTSFNKWYEEELKKCQDKITSPEKEEEVQTTSSSDFGSVVFSIGGNDYCFKEMTGMKFVFKKTEDNGIRFEMDRLVG